MSAIEQFPPVDTGLLRFSTAGSVDDGKSTLIGRLLFDSRAILADQLDTLNQRAAGDVGRALQRLDLILHQRLRVIEQPADERGLAVVHGAAGVEAEEFGGMRSVGHGGRKVQK